MVEPEVLTCVRCHYQFTPCPYLPVFGTLDGEDLCLTCAAKGIDIAARMEYMRDWFRG